MKSKFLIPVLTLLISVAALAQKSQIKEAERNLDSGNSQAALNILEESEYLIINAEESDKSDFYSLKAEVFKSLADKNIETAKNLSRAVDAYRELIRGELASGELKYIVKAKASIKEIKEKLSDSAWEDAENKKYVDGANKLYYLYLVDKKDTLNLFNSTSYFMMAKEYDLALKNYLELKALNYSGKGLKYYAVNKKSKVEEWFTSAEDRDARVKVGTHVKPRNFMSPSNKTEIYRNIAFIYNEKGDLSGAEDLYKKIIGFDPKYIDAYVSLAYLNLAKKKSFSNEMSMLGTSAEEMKAYDKLKIKMDDVLKNAVYYLEKGNLIEPKNTEITDLLLNLYRALDLSAEYNSLKARI